MNMKKVMALALAGVMTLSLAACGGGGSAATGTDMALQGPVRNVGALTSTSGPAAGRHSGDLNDWTALATPKLRSRLLTG